jgi:hypothetical protein
VARRFPRPQLRQFHQETVNDYSAFVPGVPETFDLPDCYRALNGKQLRQVEPWGPNGSAE